MKKMLVTGFIRTTTPLHVAAPSDVRYDPAKDQKVYGSDKGIALTSIQTMSIPSMFDKKSAKTNPDDVDDNTAQDAGSLRKIARVPVYAANNFSGRIRRRVADVFLESLSVNGKIIKIHAYNSIKNGAATGSPDGSPISYAEYRRVRKHPYLGIMGGGPRMATRKARIYNSIALCEESKAILEKTRIPYSRIYDGWDQLLESMSPLRSFELTRILTTRRNDDLKDLVGISKAEQVVENFQEEFEKRQTQIIEEFKQGKDREGGKTSTFTFQAMEFVIPDTSFPFVAVLEDVTDAQVGLWLRGFERFCQNEMLGGCSRNGFGEFIFTNGMISLFDENGEMTDSFDYNPNDAEKPAAEESYRTTAIAAWLDEAEKIDVAEINDLLRLPAEKPEKKGKKGKEEQVAEAA